jgi:hypothetical protein
MFAATVGYYDSVQRLRSRLCVRECAVRNISQYTNMNALFTVPRKYSC